MSKLYFKFGAMASSKTANALMTRFNYEEKGNHVWLIKPDLDNRDDYTDENGVRVTVVKSRIGLSAVADVVERMATSLFSNMQSFVSSLPVMAVKLVSGIVTGMPNVILSVVLTVISTFFISQDYERVLGFLKGCLCYETGEDLRAPLRHGNLEEVRERFQRLVFHKPRAHCFEEPGQVTERREMSKIGG
jgi:hypothetical protein